MDVKDNRFRTYFLTIFESADCFCKLDQIIQKQTNCTYAYIIHDKDTEETGELKSKHYHLYLSYKNDRTFKTIQNQFKGAHIEKVLIPRKSVQYLTHKNDQAKHQYDFNNIITNDNETIKALYLEKDFPLLNEQIIINLIIDADKNKWTLTLPYFYIVYGNEQTKKYRQMIIDLLKETKNVLELEFYNNVS